MQEHSFGKQTRSFAHLSLILTHAYGRVPVERRGINSCHWLVGWLVGWFASLNQPV
jgi:hypothetical protein